MGLVQSWVPPPLVKSNKTNKKRIDQVQQTPSNSRSTHILGLVEPPICLMNSWMEMIEQVLVSIAYIIQLST